MSDTFRGIPIVISDDMEPGVVYLAAIKTENGRVIITDAVKTDVEPFDVMKTIPEQGHETKLVTDPVTMMDTIRWADTGLPVRGNPRPCKKCGKNRTPEGHDGCLGALPGVKYACCGHGVVDGYVYFESGIVIRGMFSIEN